mmetsp:Transcript_22209/g.56422  ORF Transcript_22209/g.56422 Transcript_22209/m.56422 type:complete len:344 (-) Transcript_22209:337-1368(-)
MSEMRAASVPVQSVGEGATTMSGLPSSTSSHRCHSLLRLGCSGVKMSASEKGPCTPPVSDIPMEMRRGRMPPPAGGALTDVMGGDGGGRPGSGSRDTSDPADPRLPLLSSPPWPTEPGRDPPSPRSICPTASAAASGTLLAERLAGPKRKGLPGSSAAPPNEPPDRTAPPADVLAPASSCVLLECEARPPNDRRPRSPDKCPADMLLAVRATGKSPDCGASTREMLRDTWRLLLPERSVGPGSMAVQHEGCGSVPKGGNRHDSVEKPTCNCSRGPAVGGGHAHTSLYTCCSACLPMEKNMLPATWDSGLRAVVNGCSDSTTTDICSPPRLKLSSWRWRQNTKP